MESEMELARLSKLMGRFLLGFGQKGGKEEKGILKMT